MEKNKTTRKKITNKWKKVIKQNQEVKIFLWIFREKRLSKKENISNKKVV